MNKQLVTEMQLNFSPTTYVALEFSCISMTCDLTLFWHKLAYLYTQYKSSKKDIILFHQQVKTPNTIHIIKPCEVNYVRKLLHVINLRHLWIADMHLTNIIKLGQCSHQ